MIITRKINGKKQLFIEPDVRVQTISSATTITKHVSAIDWFFPKAEESENPSKYVGRVAKFMREWNNMTLRQAAKASKLSYPFLSRLENGKAQSLKKILYYMRGWGLEMGLSIEPKVEHDGSTDTTTERTPSLTES